MGRVSNVMYEDNGKEPFFGLLVESPLLCDSDPHQTGPRIEGGADIPTWRVDVV